MLGLLLGSFLGNKFLLNCFLLEAYAELQKTLLTCHSPPFLVQGIHKVTILDARGSNHNLSRYYAMWNEPRAELSTIVPNSHIYVKKRELYRELASAAESGWGFSSRWMRNGSDLTTTSTTSIVPVDLNALLLKGWQVVYQKGTTGLEYSVPCVVRRHVE
ncbi:probable trehalase isoform X2 [Lycium ferocissimum]|uniref:probable trehalase isoform X2 n=1 Tax=Lycium ferocissimum TaxID=112874 RepID=UPI0028160790|nr:probable trehalase isoform X2 [Lycium ferocissimum]